MKKTKQVLVSGRVQGVFFRAWTKEKAEILGVTGWVRNLSDGRVEALFQGDENVVEEMVQWCRKGPPMASVAEIRFIDADSEENYKKFSITRK